jgi:hypothetical protein
VVPEEQPTETRDQGGWANTTPLVFYPRSWQKNATLHPALHTQAAWPGRPEQYAQHCRFPAKSSNDTQARFGSRRAGPHFLAAGFILFFIQSIKVAKGASP